MVLGDVLRIIVRILGLALFGLLVFMAVDALRHGDPLFALACVGGALVVGMIMEPMR